MGYEGTIDSGVMKEAGAKADSEEKADALEPGANVMDGRNRDRVGLGGLVLLASWLCACGPKPDVADLPTAKATLARVGKRLSTRLAAADLTALATNDDRLLAALTGPERDALGRGALRFRIDRAADLYVAAPRGSEPFWLADQGFASTTVSLRDAEGPWTVARKRFDPGWVGLGVNGLDRSTRAHYAVFARSADGGRLAIEGLADDDWEVTTASDGVALERDVSGPIVGLPATLRGATLLRTRHDRRHAALLAGGRVWKTHVVAGRQPDQITIAFGNDPSTELTWSWRTRPGASASIVRLWKEGAEGFQEYRGSSTTITLRELLNDPVNLRHTVRVTGLDPDSSYGYSVGEGDGPGMSGWLSVRTAPRGLSDVSLLYLGDPQCGLEGWGKLLTAAHRRRPDTHAVLIAGDLVDRGNERSNWDHFFLRAMPVFGNVPVMPAVGNHEYLDRGPWLYRSFFALPENGPSGVESDLVYRFEIGDAFVAVLDSTAAVSDPSQARIQADWLDEQLGATRKSWKIVMFHHPLYASHPWRESPALRDCWVPVIDRHHVDLVLQGHDHAYLRTYPLRDNHRVSTPSEGTVYVVSVSGDKYVEQSPREYTEVGFSHVSTYQTIDIHARERRLLYGAYDASGRQRDGFTIEKPREERRVARRGR